MIDRNADICADYAQGTSIMGLAEKFKLSHQRIRQIVRRAGIWRKQEPRPVFLGVDVTEETKDKLKAASEESGTSMSRLASDAIERALEGEPEQ